MTKRLFVGVASVVVFLAFISNNFALVPVEADQRFASLIKADPANAGGVIAERPDELPGYETERAGWAAFEKQYGAGWRESIDRRTGVPLLVEGPGIELFPIGQPVPALPELEQKVRAFLARHVDLFKVRDAELVLNPEGSGWLDDDHIVLLFNRMIQGSPAEEQRFLVNITRGRLVSLGADRWPADPGKATFALSFEQSWEKLRSYLGLSFKEAQDRQPPRRAWVQIPTGSKAAGIFQGALGQGSQLRPVHVFALRIAGGRELWTAKVDAETGEVLAFFDETQYSRVKGGVFPVSNDGQAGDGTEQTGWPMPYADVNVDGKNLTADDQGIFDGAGAATTNLAGPYVRVNDNCGAVSMTSAVGADIDLMQGTGTDCDVPPGGSAGDTHSSRSSFYHLNRAMEKGRAWLPDNSWLKQQLTDNVNINNVCNASWNGQVNFYKSGGGCRNTGEIAGIFVHEWGHGLDQNDGGGYDSPSEVYGDTVAFLQTHVSCIGRGFKIGQNCDGYGDPCLECTGVRDIDFNMHQKKQPVRPEGFIQNNCGWGFSTGPCGKEVHCEDYLGAETVWDLAVRDLPAAGLDKASAWQLVDKLFYKSRKGSGGGIYNCALPKADGCGANAWFTKFRNVDDDDGNLSNGTPHAEAIFAAFNRHGIACGNASDPSNKNHSSCPALVQPVLTVTAEGTQNRLSWNAVTGAARYLVLRNDMSCDAGHTIVATVDSSSTSWVDDRVAPGFPLYYAVQAQGSNAACDSPVSICQAAAPADGMGSITLDKVLYGCGATLKITVRDGNVTEDTVTVQVFSSSEPTPETVVLTREAAGAKTFGGLLPLTRAAAAHADGQLSVADGDKVTAQYIDADDGKGGVNQLRQTTADVDCRGPMITSVRTEDLTDTTATIRWNTDQASDTQVHWGPVIPPTNNSSRPEAVQEHTLTLNNLSACTVYYFSTESRDAAGNSTIDDNRGGFYRFETMGYFDGVLSGCHSGRLQIDRSGYACTDTLNLTLTDLDLNRSATVADTVQIAVTSSSETTPEQVTLTETGLSTGRFTGTLPIAAVPVAADGKLSVVDRDLITALYRDSDDGSGHSALSAATAVVDCAAPADQGVQVKSITDSKAVIEWTTSEPTKGKLEWGDSPALGKVLTESSLATTHSLTVEPLTTCGRYFFRLTNTDAQGNALTDDLAGRLFQFNATRQARVFWTDNFETLTGWKLYGEWEIASPSGSLGGSNDPSSAFEGRKVLGHDVTGKGRFPREYEPGTNEIAVSPIIDASQLTNGQLRFQRWLNSGKDSEAKIEMTSRDGGWKTIWTSSSGVEIKESAWSQQVIDIKAYADGNSKLQFRFKEAAGVLDHKGGWNIDAFSIVDGSAPNFDACGGCAGVPSFVGITEARDTDPCSAGGITLTWSAAAAWGTGRVGTYAVYRSDRADFTPGPDSLVARGIAGTSWQDTGAPSGVTLYYVVRAENDQTCGDGPNNNGATDGNLVVRAVRDEVSQLPAGSILDSLKVRQVNSIQLRLDWLPAANAVQYNVWRSNQPASDFASVGKTGGLFFEDPGEGASLKSWYYLVRGADRCGNETP